MASTLVLAFLCAYFVTFPITDTDIWWHLAAGRLMADSQQWIRFDPFSRISHGAPWIDLHWGFQWIAYRIWTLGEVFHSGPFSLVIAKGLAAGALAVACWFPAFLSGQTASIHRLWVLAWAFPWALSLGYHQRYLTDIRPLWLTLVLLTIQYHLARRFRNTVLASPEHPKNRERLLLGAGMTACQVAMANIQGLFLLGPALMTAFFFGQALEASFGSVKLRIQHAVRLFPWGWLSILCLANVLNPYGMESLKLAMKVAERIIPTSGNIFSAEMAENLPLWDSLVQNPRYFLPLVLTWISALVLALSCWRNPRHRYWGEALVHLLCAILACMAQRNIPLALVSLSWWLARIAVGLDIRAWSWHKPALLGLWLAFIPAGSWAAMEMREARRFELPGSWVTPFRLPLGAVEFMSEHPIPGQVFNELRHGGYLAWSFSNPRQNFIDGRMVLRTGDQFREFLDAFDHPETFDSLRHRYQITHVLIPLLEWERYRHLGAFLLRKGEMELAYCDGATALLIRQAVIIGLGTDSAKAPVPVIRNIRDIETAIRKRFSANPVLARMAMESAREFLAQSGWTASP